MNGRNKSAAEQTCQIGRIHLWRYHVDVITLHNFTFYTYSSVPSKSVILAST